MNKKVMLFASFAMLVVSSAAFADIVKGRVVDTDTKEPLPEATVKLTQKFGDNGYMMMNGKTDSLGVFLMHADGKCTVEASMLGYYSKKKTVLVFSDSRKDTLDIGTIELKMSPQMLKMVSVTGRARRFTVRGDTIVFHPEAFHLQEGARLDELISQLPGVEVDGQGRMSWNGKPIRLTMDGESMLGGDQLMKQLPAEAVQDIKAYNKASEFSERTGKNDGTQDMVLDLTIKPGFLDRWYGDVTAGYQTPKYYEGELTMNRLSKTDPVMAFANANNIDKKLRKSMNGWSGSWGHGYGLEQGMAAGYQHKWKKKEGTQEMKSQYTFSGNMTHDDGWSTTHEETENYLPNTAATRNNSERYYRDHKLSPTLNADLRWAADSQNTFSLRASVEHVRKRSHSRQTEEQSEAIAADPTLSLLAASPTLPLLAAVPYAAILSQRTLAHNEGDATTISTTAMWEHYIKDGALSGSLSFNYTDGKTDSWTDRTVTSHVAALSSSKLSQSSSSPNAALSADAQLLFSNWLTKKWLMKAQYTFRYSRNKRDCDFLTNGVADAANSYRDRSATHTHSLRIGSTFNLAPFQVMPNVTAQWQRESQDYRRGLLDTAAVRHRLLLQPDVRATWKLSKTVGLELNYGYRTSLPALLQTIGYRDLTNPLFITEGNPGLKDSHSHDVKLSYNMVLARSQTSLSIGIGYQANDRDRVTALSYHPATAVYVSRTENVSGSRTWELRLDVDQALGELLRLENEFRLNTGRHYGYLTQVLTTRLPLSEGSGERHLNRQASFHPKNRLTLSLDKDWLKASVFAKVEADRLRFSASPEQNTTLWNNDFGLKAEATLGKFVFETDLTETTRRGYAAPSMNRNMLIWNAAVTWKILKNKARLKLEFEDILNKQDNFWSDRSAYQHSTSWQDFRHHYVNISFTYHLDAKKKD
ncbi:MAG: outer membrane beta-barrel protein [Prevotella sp.]|nr:outer membrane beta-barrel protein [Prevotella sp.]